MKHRAKSFRTVGSLAPEQATLMTYVLDQLFLLAIRWRGNYLQRYYF